MVQARAEDHLEAMVQECATGPKRKTGRPGLCQWIQGGYARCRLCPFRFATTDPVAAQKALKNHFGSHHRGFSPSGAAPMCQQLPSLVAPLSADQDCAWKCKYCECGISTEAALSAGRPRVARDKKLHKSQAHPSLSWKQWYAKDRSERALATTVTKFKATAQKHPPVPGFRTFRWPKHCGKKSSLTAKFLLSWACLTCHAPFISHREAVAHTKVCPSVYGRARAAERLKTLLKLKSAYARNTPIGPRRTAELALFQEAAQIFERAAQPFP